MNYIVNLSIWCTSLVKITNYIGNAFKQYKTHLQFVRKLDIVEFIKELSAGNYKRSIVKWQK